MRKKRTIQLILSLFLVTSIIGTICGGFLTYKSYAEIYSVIHPLGDVEINIKQMLAQALEDWTKLSIGHMSKCYASKSTP